MSFLATTLATLALAAPQAEGNGPPADKPVCDKKCKHKRWHRRQYTKLRNTTPYNPIPISVRNCESGSPHEYSYKQRLHRVADDGLGGGLCQIIPSTWRDNLPSRRFIHIVGGNKGPIWSSRLLQDKVAHTIITQAGLSQWVCA